MLPSFTLVLLFVGCRLEDEDQGPRIAVDACATNEVADCLLDFGERDLSVRVQGSVVVSNPSLISPLTILNVDSSGDPAFRIVEEPSLIPPRSSEVIIIDVRPNVVAVSETELLIQTDATNTRLSPDGASVVFVQVKVTGVNNGLPNISVEPPACVFDDATPTCLVSIRNTGNRELAIDELLLQCADACPFSIDDPTPDPIGLNDSALVVEVTFTPTPGSFTGTLTIFSSDPDEPSLAISLSATSS